MKNHIIKYYAIKTHKEILYVIVWEGVQAVLFCGGKRQDRQV